VSFVTQYDVEIWLRIENALGKKIEEEDIPKDEVMVLMERIGEAQRVAVKEMKEIHNSRSGLARRGRARRGRDEKDQEEG
jgi:ATP-dependent RNA helicase DDX47/RRP3